MAPPTTKIRAAPPSAFHQQLDPRFSSHSLQPNSLHRRRGSSSSSSDIDGWGYSPRSSWSPSTAATSISGSSHVSRGRRRASSFTSPSNSRPILVNHDVRARSPQHPMVFQQTTRDQSPVHRSGRTIVMPGSSIKSGRRGSASSRGASEYSKSIYGSSPPRNAYHGNYNYARREMSRRHEGDFDAPRKGRTKFPLRLVAEEAVDRMQYPYTIEENGSIVVLQALRRPEIDELIDMTAQLRLSSDRSRSLTRTISVKSQRRSTSSSRHHHRHRSRSRHHSQSRQSLARSRSRSHSRARKAVSFHEEALVHEVDPDSPFHPSKDDVYSISEFSEPVTYIERPVSSDHDYIIHETNARSPRLIITPPPAPLPPALGPVETTTTAVVNHPGEPPAYQTTTTTRVEPLQPPGPSTPKLVSAKTIDLTPHLFTGKTPGRKVAEAEERALKAQHVAALKEKRAIETRLLVDQKEALKARRRANELLLKAEEVARKERKKRRSRSVSARLTVGKNARGETVIVQDR